MTNSNMNQWFVFDVNPYPWKVPPISVGRKGKGVYPVVGRDEGLHTYKQAIKEQIGQMPHWKIDGPVVLNLWFYRNVPKYTTQSGRRAKKHDADTTNMQKATEDALQGFLFDNDSEVTIVSSHRVEQSESTVAKLVVCVLPYTGGDPLFPPEVKMQIGEIDARNSDPDPTCSIESNQEDIPF